MAQGGAPYDHRQLQSLLGYGRTVNERSGGICQLCGFGSGETADCDLWRQLTVEHLVGAGDGGYPKRIRAAVDDHFPDRSVADRVALADSIHRANMVAACHFCNAATSREHAPCSMEEVIAEAATEPDVLPAVARRLQPILEHKRAATGLKLAVVREAFEAEVAPTLNSVRAALVAASPTSIVPPGPDVTETVAAAPASE